MPINQPSSRRSLFSEMQFWLIAVVSVVSLLTALVVYNHFKQQSERQYRESLAEYTQYLTRTLEQPLWNMEEDLVKTICTAFATRGNIAVLTVRNEKGQVLCDRRQGKAMPDFARMITIRHNGQPVGQFDLALDATNYNRSNLQLLTYNLATTLALLAAVAILLQFVLRRLLQQPLSQLIDRIERFAAGNPQTEISPDERKEFAIILQKFNEMAGEVAARQAALAELNLTLERRVQEELTKNREKDLLLIQQSRLAAMGEMVHNIAHQWRQPLNALAVVINNIKDDFKYGELDQESLFAAVAKANRLLQSMSTTIDDFRNFFLPDREAVDFDVAHAVREAASILEASLKNNLIELQMILPEKIMAQGFPSQFSQSVLNLLVNAKEAIIANQQQNGTIVVRLEPTENGSVLTIDDNGGGIPDTILPKIFDPYFTTKDQGSGIGLYMSKMIIEKNMQGRVGAMNIQGGARFTITLPRINGLSDRRSNKRLTDEPTAQDSTKES